MGLFSFSKRSGGPSTAASAGIAVLGGVQVSLTLLEKLMDGVPVPFVKGAAGAAIEVIKIARVMHSNKMDCNDLLQRVTSLLVIILSSFDGKTDVDIPGHLRRGIERLTLTFHDILAELGTIDRRNKRVIINTAYYISNAEKLKGCASKLDWAMQEFQVTSRVESCLKDLERHQELVKGQAKILEAVEKVQKAMEHPSFDLPSSVMPADPIIFGRQEYVDRAVGLVLSNNTARLAILGPGGMGKTSVALKVVHDARIRNRFGKNCHWVACEQATSLSFLIELVARSLGLHNSQSNDRFSDIVTTLELSNVPQLFLLDNFETPWDVEGQQSDIGRFLARLSSISSVSLILTMRGNQHPASDLVQWSLPRLPPLDQLHLDAAREAFLRIAPDAVSDPGLDPLIHKLDCVPLAITLMAKLAETGDSPSDLLLQWQSELTGLLDHPGGDRSNSIEVSIKLSLQSNLVRHCNEAIPLLGIVAKLPGGTLLDHLPSLCQSIPNWKKGLRVLRTTALIYESADKSTVHVLSPIQSFIMKHHPPGSNSLKDIRSTYYKLAEKGDSDPGNPDFLGNVKDLARVEANMESVLLDALRDKGVEEAAVVASLHYSNYIYWTHPQEIISAAAVDVTRTFHHHWLAKCLRFHAKILQGMHQYDAAESAFRESRSEYIAIGDQLGAARCKRSLGVVLRMKGQYDAAESALQEAKSEFVVIGDRLGVAQCTQSLGDILVMTYQHDAAESTFREARSEFVALENRLGTAQCLKSLGEILFTKRQFDAAESALREARQEFVTIGERIDAAQSLKTLGKILHMKHEYDAAESAQREARSEFTAAGDQLGAVQCTQSIGDLLHIRGDYEEAVSALKEARSGFVAMGNQLGAARCMRSLGDIYVKQHQYDAGESALQEARSELVTIGDRLPAALCLLSLARILKRKRRYDAVKSTLEMAKSEFTAVGDQLGVVECSQLLDELRFTVTEPFQANIPCIPPHRRHSVHF